MRWQPNALAVFTLCAPVCSAQSQIHNWLGFGQSQPAEFGLHVRGIGDVDGDGRPDVAVGAPLDDYDAVTINSGKVEILSGATGLVLHVYFGTAGQQLGSGISPAGDLDADGRADFAINSYGEGRTRVYSGATGLVLLTLPSTSTLFGPSSVDGGHDVDADGTPDILVGYPVASPFGRVRLYSGATGSVLREWVDPSSQQLASFGHAVVFVGDVDLNGRRDVAVGSRQESTISGIGAVRVYSSATGALLWSRNGGTNAYFGTSVARLGDVNGDGLDDVGVGAPLAGGSAIGAAFVLAGGSGTILYTKNGTLVGGQFGTSIAGPGDIDADGYADFAVGAPYGPTSLPTGMVHAYSGRFGTPLWTLPSTQPGDWFGTALSEVGDVDGDGRVDLAVGAPRHAVNPGCGVSCTWFGRVTVHTGCDGCPVVAPYCFGDGTATACPCGNTGGPKRGCANGSISVGAVLAHVGRASVANDDLVLQGSGLPPTAPALFFQGDAREAGGSGVTFGDGLRCAAGAIVRLAVRFATVSSCAYPDMLGDPSVSMQGGIPAGGAVTRHYQLYYRDAAAFCTPATFNLSNGLSVTWVP